MATKKTTSKSAPARKTATKKTTSRSTARAKAPVKPVEEKVQLTPVKTTTTAETTKGFKLKKSYLILFAIVVIVAVGLFLSRSYFVAAVVNGQPVSRLSVLSEAEKLSGKQVLSTQIRNILIEQEARKQNITVSEKDVDDEVKKLEGTFQKQGQKLEQVLTMQGMTQTDLRKILKLNLMVSKMVGKDIKITDQQVNEYIEKNKEMLPQGQNEAELKNTVREQLKQQELNEKIRTWLENLQKNAKINKFVDY